MIEIKWMNRSVLALSIGLALSGQIYAQDQETEIVESQPAIVDENAVAIDPNSEAEQSAYIETEQVEIADDTVNAEASAEVEAVQTSSDATAVQEETSSSDVVSAPENASQALQQQEGDATQQDNLEEVFTASEQQYSLVKKGSYSATYDFEYSYYRDTQLDLALDDGSSNLTRLRIEDNANHNITNTFTVQYGLLNNLTLTASLPLVAKSDVIKDATTAGLGDISFGARWEPFPLKQGRLPLILFGNLSTKTGDSPYEVNANNELSTGKGYYSVGAGASTRKYIDPVVLFASVSANYGFEESDINQLRGQRILDSFDPGISGGFAFGYAYSFNYDVSMTMSYQQSFNTASEYRFTSGETSEPADQSSASLSISLGVRVSPETIVNGSVGIGLTEDAPDISLGLSFPLDFLGFGKQVR
ncbi:putative pilus system protein FilC [Acinetobacter sedimenti]|uniref:putative pilus system protein FilC n=1 Tax=Acinetobacter sedimenti TaxID=2919922 RepID=UPI0038990858